MRKFMQFALGAFLLAAVTGALLRFGLYQGMPTWAQNFTAIRHAHSHLMYFGWATLAIMAMIWRLLPQWTHAPLPRLVNWQMGATALLALLSFPAFWSNGYGLTQIGALSLPLGSMVAGLNGATWMLFALLYARATLRLHERPLPVQLWDWAIVLLLLSCGGALGLVLLIMLDNGSLFLQQTMLHLFLELFAMGWFTLALLGLLWGWIAQQRPLPQRALPVWLPTQSLAFFLAPTFFLGMSPALLPDHIFWISAGANAIAAALLAWHVVALWRERDALPLLARFALLALSLHVLVALALLWPGLWRWGAATQLRIFYLHNLLLGWASSGLLGLAIALWFPLSQRGARRLQVGWMGGVSAMLPALLGLGLAGVWATIPALVWLQLAAWSSVVVAATIGAMAIYALFAPRAPQPQAISPQSDWEMAGSAGQHKGAARTLSHSG